MKRIAVVLAVLMVLVLAGTALAMNVQNESLNNAAYGWGSQYTAMLTSNPWGCTNTYSNWEPVIYQGGFIYQVVGVTPGESADYFVVTCSAGASGNLRVKYKKADGTIISQHDKYFSGGGIHRITLHNVPSAAATAQIAVHNHNSYKIVVFAAGEGKPPIPIPGA